MKEFFAPTEQLQLAVSPPQGFDPRLAVTLPAQEPAEFGHRPYRVPERQGLARRSRRFLRGGQALTLNGKNLLSRSFPSCDDGGRS